MPKMTREAMLSRQRKTIEVADPESGDTFTLRALSLAEREEMERAQFPEGDFTKPNLVDLRERLLALCVIEPEMSIEDWRKVDAGLGMFLFTEAQRLNGMAPAAVGDAAKNS